jgi:hypothetical protein
LKSQPTEFCVETPATPSLRQQLAATVEAAKRLVRAHVGLAKTELGEIVDEVKRMVALGALALALVLMVGLLLTLGGILFLGEWIFGSIGWGVLLGTFLLLDLAVVAVLVALGVAGGRLGITFIVAAAIGVVVGLVLGLDLTHRGWSALGDSIAPTFDPASRARNIAVIALAGFGGLLGLIAGFRAGRGGGAIAGLVGGGILGALIGLLTSTEIPPTVGAAIGTWVTLIAWPVLAGRNVMRTGIDGEALRQRFVPDQTIELTKETIDWVRARTPLAPKS